MQVIDACNNGRYMHGNGAQWYIINTDNNKVCIDTTTSTPVTTLVPSYTGEAYTNYTTARNLEDFLMSCHGEITETKRPYDMAKRYVRDLVMDGYCVYINGGQWYMNVNGNVSCYELGALGEWATVRYYDALSSWRYLQSTGGGKATVTQSIKDYLHIG